MPIDKSQLSKRTAAVAIPHTISVAEPDDPSDVFEMTLHALDPLASVEANEYARDVQAKFLQGNWLDGEGKLQANPKSLALIECDDGSKKPVMVSEDLLYVLAWLERMQGVRRSINDPEPTDEWSVKDLAIVAATRPAAWDAIQEKYRFLRMHRDGSWVKKNSKDLGEKSPGDVSTTDSQAPQSSLTPPNT